jgi:hypothetical protein
MKRRSRACDRSYFRLGKLNCAPAFLDVYKEAEDRDHLRVNPLKAPLPE